MNAVKSSEYQLFETNHFLLIWLGRHFNQMTSFILRAVGFRPVSIQQPPIVGSTKTNKPASALRMFICRFGLVYYLFTRSVKSILSTFTWLHCIFFRGQAHFLCQLMRITYTTKKGYDNDPNSAGGRKKWERDGQRSDQGGNLSNNARWGRPLSLNSRQPQQARIMAPLHLFPRPGTLSVSVDAHHLHD